MIAIQDSGLRNQMLDIIAEEHQLAKPREGMHVSDLNHCLTKTYWDRVNPQPLSATEKLLFSVGWGLERVIIPRLHVEPIVVDGITMSIDFELSDGTIADLKTTRMSPAGRKGENGFQFPETWLRQFMSYRYGWCRQGGYPDEYDFGVVVLHLIQPELVCWRLIFTPEELEQNWQTMLERSNVLESMIAAQDPQSYQHKAFEAECDKCSRALLCQLQASTQRRSYFE